MVARPTARVAADKCERPRKMPCTLWKKVALGKMNAEDLRQLIHDDHHADSRLESDQHGFRNKVSHESQAQDRRQNQHGADQQGEDGARLQQSRHLARRHRLAQCGAGQDRDGRGGGDAERPRGAEDGVHHEGHKGRIQPHLDGQSGDGGVRHGLRDDHRRGRQTRDDIRSQPVFAVVGQPIQQRQAKRSHQEPWILGADIAINSRTAWSFATGGLHETFVLRACAATAVRCALL